MAAFTQTFVSALPLLLSLFGSSKAQVPNLGPQLSQQISFDNVRFTECNNFVKTCAPTIASCASVVCQQCSGLGVGGCCGKGDPAPTACLGSALLQGKSGGGGGSVAASTPIITPTPSAGNAGGSDACSSFEEFYDICGSLTPDFSDISDFSTQASCLCYSSASWVPSIFDSYVSQCGSYLSASSPAAFASITADAPWTSNPCQAVGDVEHGGSGAATPAPTGGKGGGSGTTVSGSGQFGAGVSTTASTAASKGVGNNMGSGNLFARTHGAGIQITLYGVAISTFALAIFL